MSTVTRQRIKPCGTKGCPFSEDEHFNFCGHQSAPTTHQHYPKRSQGGTEIAALLCPSCHDRVDNGNWRNAVEDGVYRLYDDKDRLLIEREIGR